MPIRGFAYLLLALAAAPACGKVGSKAADGGVNNRADAATGGADAGSADAATSAMCDPSAITTPVADSCGVFVDAANGYDGNVPSSKAKPLETLVAALAEVKVGGAIYACSDAALDGGVTVPSGLKIYGGLKCGTWTYDANTPTTITGAAGVVPLTLTSGTASTTLADLYLQATSASSPGGSSIGLIADGAQATLHRILIVAGNGAKGDPGTTTSGQATSGTVGNGGGGACSALSIPGGPAVTLTCGTDTSIGGKGGDGAYYGYDGASGSPGANNHGAGGSTTGICGAGGLGAGGAVGSTGTPGTGLGTIDAQGYAGVVGGTGGTGAIGQGGGGGGGGSGLGNCPVNTYGGASGGSGGTGGCGGAGGTGGQPGGSSIGIISLNASLTFDQVTIQTGDGGDGGAGGAGQTGGNGADGAAGGGPYFAGCAGGKGGAGGLGGIGGGGTGGHAVGIAYTGAMPPAAMVTFTLGTAGTGGGAGDAAGANGVAANTQAF